MFQSLSAVPVSLKKQVQRLVSSLSDSNSSDFSLRYARVSAPDRRLFLTFGVSMSSSLLSYEQRFRAIPGAFLGHFSDLSPPFPFCLSLHCCTASQTLFLSQ